MKIISKILVLTDFSDTSEDVFELAMDMAIKTQASIHVYHHLSPSLSELKNSDNDDSKEYLQSYIQQTRTKINSYVIQGKQKNIFIETSFSQGNIISDLQEVIQKYGCDVILVGSNNKNLIDRIYMGSVSRKVVRNIQLPVIVVKKDTKSIEPRNAVFVSGLDENERNCFKYFLHFAKAMGAKVVHLLTIDTTSYFSQPTIVMKEATKEYEKIAKNIIKCESHFNKGIGISDGVEKFLKANSIGLIGIANDDHSSIKRILLGSKVEMLLATSDIPIMAIDFPDQ